MPQISLRHFINIILQPSATIDFKTTVKSMVLSIFYLFKLFFEFDFSYENSNFSYKNRIILILFCVLYIRLHLCCTQIVPTLFIIRHNSPHSNLSYFLLESPTLLSSIKVFIELGFFNNSGNMAFIIVILGSSIGAVGTDAFTMACIVSVSLL